MYTNLYCDLMYTNLYCDLMYTKLYCDTPPYVMINKASLRKHYMNRSANYLNHLFTSYSISLIEFIIPTHAYFTEITHHDRSAISIFPRDSINRMTALNHPPPAPLPQYV